jgi:hypothetical protein
MTTDYWDLGFRFDRALGTLRNMVEQYHNNENQEINREIEKQIRKIEDCIEGNLAVACLIYSAKNGPTSIVVSSKDHHRPARTTTKSKQLPASKLTENKAVKSKRKELK